MVFSPLGFLKHSLPLELFPMPPLVRAQLDALFISNQP